MPKVRNLNFIKLTVLIAPCLLLIAHHVSAQKGVIKAKGEAKMKVESWMSLDMAKEKVKEEAMLNAIEGHFLSYIEKESTINILDGETKFNIHGKRVIRGEWIKHLKEAKYNFYEVVPDKKTNHKEYWVECNVEGLVREITRARAFWEAEPLNCPDVNCRQTSFKDRENFYLYFKAAMPGFFSIYYAYGENVYRLLPYYNMPSQYRNAIPVKADKDYIFFSGKKGHHYFDDFSYHEVHPMEMRLEGDAEEELKLFLVFGTKEYIKPVLNNILKKDDFKMPEFLTRPHFDQWLSELKLNDYDLTVRELDIKIFK